MQVAELLFQFVLDVWTKTKRGPVADVMSPNVTNEPSHMSLLDLPSVQLL